MLSELVDILSLIILTYGRKKIGIKIMQKVKFKPEVEVSILYSGVLK